MDKFGVPKKINRHVLKALYYMNTCELQKSNLSNICELVRITMKNNVPVRDLPGMVQQSLKNMSQLGVITKKGSNFFVSNASRLSKVSKLQDKVDQLNDNSELNPNLRRRRHESDDSMSDNEVEKSRKRFRLSRPLSRKGRNVLLPKIKIPSYTFNVNTDISPNGCISEENFSDEEKNSNLLQGAMFQAESIPLDPGYDLSQSPAYTQTEVPGESQWNEMQQVTTPQSATIADKNEIVTAAPSDENLHKAQEEDIPEENNLDPKLVIKEISEPV